MQRGDYIFDTEKPLKWTACMMCMGKGYTRHASQIKNECSPCNGMGVVRIKPYAKAPNGAQNKVGTAAQP